MQGMADVILTASIARAAPNVTKGPLSDKESGASWSRELLLDAWICWAGHDSIISCLS